MKKIVASFLVLAIVIGANAQHEGHKGMRKKQRHGMAMEKLNLSDDQKTKFKTLHEDFRKQMQALNKQDNLTVKEWRARKETLRKEHKSKIETILTKEQKDQVSKMKEERKTRGKKMGEKRAGMMKQHLNLTDDQSKKIKELNTGLHDKIKNIRENETLAREQKREQIHGLMKENHEKMKSILTEEQLKKVKEMKDVKQLKQKHQKERSI
jgi:Spy/CpxP family protein refolding chaperone